MSKKMPQDRLSLVLFGFWGSFLQSQTIQRSFLKSRFAKMSAALSEFLNRGHLFLGLFLLGVSCSYFEGLRLLPETAVRSHPSGRAWKPYKRSKQFSPKLVHPPQP